MTLSRSSLSIALLSFFAGCSTPPAMPPQDAGPSDTGVPVDAGPIVPSWANGPDYPDPIAFGSAMVLPGSDGTSAYLYVIGGSSGSFASLAPFHAEIRRSLIQADGSLGPWMDAGAINTGHTDYALAGHGAIRVVAEDGSIGFAIAGGGGPMGYLGLVLAGYIQPIDGSIGMWGAFAPQIMAPQGGEAFGSFDAFESHQLALVGGMQGSTPTDQVIIAATMAGTMVPTWRDGPPLPTPRYGHGSVQVGTGAPDIYLVGGSDSTGPLTDVLVTTRDAATMEVAGWSVAGVLSSPGVVFPQVVLIHDHVWVIGGVEGDPSIDALSTRVRMATVSTGPSGTGIISTFTHVAGGDLPAGRAGGLTATFGNNVYIVGGMMGADHMASTSVTWAQLER